MDEKGFIFTADATLALVVIIVLTVTVVSYTMLPMYMGQEHQHLEALADSALQVMEQDGTLRDASVIYANNSTNATYNAQQRMNESIRTLIPNGIGYRLTINPGTSVSVDNVGAVGTPTYSTDVVTRVRVISGPKEGWWGRAWYKSEPVEFTQKPINITSTVWNFHNWLTNFYPWSQSGNLRSYPYWGSGSVAGPINFAIPAGSTIRGATYLQGSSSVNRYANPRLNPSFGTNTIVNGRPALVANSNQYTFLNQRVSSIERMYNYQGNIPVSSLTTGVNNFYVNFVTDSNYNYNMPWFSIIANYTTNITVPINVTTAPYYFQDAAGLAVPYETELGNGTGYGRIYNLDNGQVTNLNTLREIDWDDMIDHNHAFSDGIPFVIHDVPGVGGTADGSAVSVVQDITVPSNQNILDSYVVVNAWGAVDSALVEVWDSASNNWRTVFCSFDVDGNDYSARADGYGNIPGIIYIGDELRQGANNKVRITVWDDVPSSDYDLVGLENCFTMLSTSEYKVKWDTYPFNSHQSNNNVEEQTNNFVLTSDSQKAMLFVGTGLNTRNIRVRYADTGQELYNGPVPFSLDLASIDAQKGFFKITYSNSTATNYTIRPGNYALRVTVTGPTNAWESGDWDANAAMFSGTRIVVVNPQILNEWSAGMGSTPQEAMLNATGELKRLHPGVQDAAIRTSALFAGNLPNSVPVRLELWKQ